MLCESLHESSHNSHAPVKRGDDKSWLVKRAQTLINSHENLNQFKVDQS